MCCYHNKFYKYVPGLYNILGTPQKNNFFTTHKIYVQCTYAHIFNTPKVKKINNYKITDMLQNGFPFMRFIFYALNNIFTNFS